MAQQNPYIQKPVRRKPVSLNLPGASVTPAASPVDTYFRTNLPQPSQTNELLQVAGALAPFSKSLGNYLQFNMENQQDEAKIQAEQDIKEWSPEFLRSVAQLSQEQMKELGILDGPVASRPDYYIAAKINMGKRLGGIGREKYLKRYGEIRSDLTDPTKEPDIGAALDQLREEVMGKFGELGYYAQGGAATAIDPLVESLKKKTMEERLGRVEDENVENLTVELVEVFSSYAADTTRTPGERTKMLADIQAQLELYPAVGGKNRQGLIMRGAEQAALALVEDDPDGSEAIAFLEDLKAMPLGPGGRAFAKPGTKAFEAILELEDVVEAKAEENRTKGYREESEKDRMASKEADDIASAFINQTPAGTPLDDDTKRGIREAFERHGLLKSAAESEIRNLDAAARSGEVETETAAYIQFTEMTEDGGTIPEGLLAGALRDGRISRSDYTRFSEKSQRNLKTPEIKREQEEAWSLFVRNTIGDPKSYPEKVRIELENNLSSQLEVFRNQAEETRDDSALWNQFLRDWKGSGGAIAQQFRDDNKHLLDMRSDNSATTVGASAEVQAKYRVYRNRVDSLAPDFGADFDPTQARAELGRHEALVENAWNSAVQEVTKEVTSDGSIPVEAVNAEVSRRLSDRFPDLLQQALGDTERIEQEALVAQKETGRLAPVAGREDQLGTEEAFETGVYAGIWDNLDMMQAAHESLEAISGPVVDQELLQEQRDLAETHKVETDAWIAGMNQYLMGQPVDAKFGRLAKHTFGAPHFELRFYDGDAPRSGKTGWPDRYSAGRLQPTREGILPTLKATWAFKGLPAEQIAEQGLEAALGTAEGKGLVPSDIDLGLMRLDLTEDQLGDWMEEYDQTLTGPKGSEVTTDATKGTKMYKLLEALELPIMYDAAGGKEDHSAKLLRGRQMRHLGLN